MKISISRLITTTLVGVMLGALIIAGCGNKEPAVTNAISADAVPTRDPSQFKPGMPRSKK